MSPIRRIGIWRSQAGVAMVEFALALPVLMTLLYGVIETTRYILITQKVEKLSHSVADVVAQSTVVTTASLNQLLEATGDIMKPFAFGTQGTVIISSLYRQQGSADARVNWRYQGGGTLTASSQFGAVGAVPVMPAGFTFEERENVIAVEVYYQFTPLLTSQFFGTGTVYRYAFYRPRFGNLTAAPV